MIDIYRFVPDDDERKRISKVAGVGRDYDMDLVLATIKKVIRWSDEPCHDHDEAQRREWGWFVKRRACPLCWQEINKELEKGPIGRKIGFGYLRQEIKDEG